MASVLLKYVGATKHLVITWPVLTKAYTFDSETGSEAVVSYEDARILLEKAGKSFKVVSGLLPEQTSEPKQAEEVPAPIIVNDDPSMSHLPIEQVEETTPEEFSLIVEGDGVEGTGPMPAPFSGEEKLTKKGKKK